MIPKTYRKINIGAIIQARTGSTRLREKILKELPYASGITVLEQVIRRVRRSRVIKKVIVATTGKKRDKIIINLAKKENVAYHLGSENDVLARFFSAARKHRLDIIVRITSDCPCIDSELMDLTIHRHLVSGVDYSSNTLRSGFPHGFDVEVFNFKALQKTYIEARKEYEREHVTPYIYRNPGIFKILCLKAPLKLFAPDVRLTLDTEDDYILLCAIFDFLYHKNKYFGQNELVQLFKKKPWLRLINKIPVQKILIPKIKK